MGGKSFIGIDIISPPRFYAVIAVIAWNLINAGRGTTGIDPAPLVPSVLPIKLRPASFREFVSTVEPHLNLRTYHNLDIRRTHGLHTLYMCAQTNYAHE